MAEAGEQQRHGESLGGVFLFLSFPARGYTLPPGETSCKEAWT
jgi:hypothetical protein